MTYQTPKIITNKWIPCSDENYWTEDENYVTIVKTKLTDGTTGVWVDWNCPYGWNVLCDMKSELMNIKL